MVKPVTSPPGARPASYFAKFAAGETIFREAEAGASMFIIQSGQVEIFRQQGGKEKQIAVLGPGDFFGEMSVLEEIPRTAAARALQDSQLLQIDATTFDQVLRQNPEIAVRMMRRLSRRLRTMEEAEEKAHDAAMAVLGAKPAAPAAAAAPAPAAVFAAALVHASGVRFAVDRDEMSVGRPDPVTGLAPDLDLSPLDAERSLSRRHAKLGRTAAGVTVREEIGTANGTFVNGKRLQTGVPVELADGDEVAFGLVKLKFHAAG
jgi:CRP-like cAMP-binding protein